MIEKHPYKEFIPEHPRKMIIGSFPIGKFSDPNRRHEIKSNEIDFFFGGEKNLLWKLLGDVYGIRLNTIPEIKNFLENEGIAIGDIIKSCRRKNGGASDSSLYDIKWNVDLLKIINLKKIDKIFFTSKRVEYWFNQLFPNSTHVKKVTLISPSAQSMRSLYHLEEYQKWIKRFPRRSKYDYILRSYRKVFETDS